jgi:citrate lyase gamma subunit
MQIEVKVEFTEQQKAVVCNTLVKGIVELTDIEMLDHHITLIEERSKALFNRAFEFSQEKTFKKIS